MQRLNAVALRARQSKIIGNMERIVQRDEGGRGTKHLSRPVGELEKIARSLHGAKKVTLLTGFPCVQNAEVPTETDGPSGTVAICNALLKLDLGIDVAIITDECNLQVMRACTEAALPELGSWTLESFPPKDLWEPAHQEQLTKYAAWSDHVLALERASPGPDGHCHTMSGRVMGSDMIAPLDQLFSEGMRLQHGAYTTTCVGDGGNELGMGSVAEAVCKHVENGEVIVSSESADFLLAVSVSNWGGYAIAGALQVLSDSKVPLMPTTLEETRCIQAAVDAGAHDGVLMIQALSVDGLSIDVHCRVLDELNSAICADL